MGNTIRQSLASAARDGTISVIELRKIQNEHGLPALRQALKNWAYDSYLPEWSPLAAARARELLGRNPKFSSHQLALLAMAAKPRIAVPEIEAKILPEGEVIDVNGSGSVDADDRIVTRPAYGSPQLERVGETSAGRARFMRSVVDAAERFGKAGHSFALLNPALPEEEQQSFSATMWDKRTRGAPGSYKLKEGVRPSVAIRDLLANPDNYRFECATALVLIYYTAVLNTMGDREFDKKFPNLLVGAWRNNELLDEFKIYEGTETKEMTPEGVAALVPGDYVYFMNPDVSEAGLASGWRGENAIYLGNGKFYGHPFGVTDAASIIEHLNGFRVEGATKSAYMSSARYTQSPDRMFELIP